MAYTIKSKIQYLVKMMRGKHFLISLVLTGTLVHAALAQTLGTGNDARPTAPFFMPQKVLTPKYETLPPIPSRTTPQETPSQSPQKAQTPAAQTARATSRDTRYVAVDGYFVPVVDKAPEPAADKTNEAPSLKPDSTTESIPEQASTQPAEPTPNQVERPEHEADKPVPPANLPPRAAGRPDPEPESRPFFRDTSPKPEIRSLKPSTATAPAPQVAEVSDGEPMYRTLYAAYLSDLQAFQQTGTLPENKTLSESLARLSKPQTTVLFDKAVTPRRTVSAKKHSVKTAVKR